MLLLLNTCCIFHLVVLAHVWLEPTMCKLAAPDGEDAAVMLAEARRSLITLCLPCEVLKNQIF